MKATIISFSARKTMGNCKSIAQVMAESLEAKGFSTVYLDINDYTIKPCSNCDYQCFQAGQTCPITDDVSGIYQTLSESHLIIVVIPVYSAAAPATFYAFRERGQDILRQSDFYDRFEKIKKCYCVIGNQIAGADAAITSIIADDELSDSRNVLLLQSKTYNQSSISGKLCEISAVRDKIKDFVSTIA